MLRRPREKFCSSCLRSSLMVEFLRLALRITVITIGGIPEVGSKNPVAGNSNEIVNVHIFPHN